MKKLISIGVCISILLGSTACRGPIPDSREYIKVTAQSPNTNSMINLEAVAALDYTEFFGNKMSGIQEIPYTLLGNNIQISLADPSVQSCELMEYILNKDGQVKYDDRTIRTRELPMKSGKGAFTLERNSSASASSNSMDYEEGAAFLGFRLIAQGKDEVQEYAFVVRTDVR